MADFDSALDALRHFAQVAFLAAAALLPIVNPLGSAAMYLQITAGVDPRQRDHLARLVVFDAFLLLLGAALLGAYVHGFVTGAFPGLVTHGAAS
jgi:multiple antibiotic resistance protein